MMYNKHVQESERINRRKEQERGTEKRGRVKIRFAVSEYQFPQAYVNFMYYKQSLIKYSIYLFVFCFPSVGEMCFFLNPSQTNLQNSADSSKVLTLTSVLGFHPICWFLFCFRDCLMMQCRLGLNSLM